MSELAQLASLTASSAAERLREASAEVDKKRKDLLRWTNEAWEKNTNSPAEKSGKANSPVEKSQKEAGGSLSHWNSSWSSAKEWVEGVMKLQINETMQKHPPQPPPPQ
eukprot:3302432-Pyramimonas_sp.AAC.1